ncbi:MAG TPA: imidazole glycerol phosphate synthase subunit HisH [Gemmatimonadaceae bacterium]|nr:imidazole glycerol phosphate synthase subunit HisH [Gemmatimonadaceae bacterium]
MRVTMLDYGAGNLHSLGRALAGAGRTVRVEADPLRALDTDVLVLPGVGAFGPAAARLAPARAAMRDAMQSGLPTLGVCLGMQLLFDASDEGEGEGLGIFPGRVQRLRSARTPHMGWNTLEDVDDPLFDASALSVVYYANSFACRGLSQASDETERAASGCRVREVARVTAWSTHGPDRFVASVRRGMVMGVQFHPEKSGAPGWDFLDRFLRSLPDSRIPSTSKVTF